MSRIDFTRNWLDRNKVFFETIGALLLSVMAVVVSIKANQIAEFEAVLAKAELLPTLHFDVDLRKEPETGHWAFDELVISNIGRPLRSFDSNPLIFLEIEYWPKNGPGGTVLIPVVRYYDTSFVGSEMVGQLTRHTCSLKEGNNRKAFYLERAVSQYAKTRAETALARIVRYVRVRYTDLIGETHDEVYLVDTFTSRLLPERDGKYISDHFERWNNLNQVIDFHSQINAEDIMNKAAKVFAQRPQKF